MRAALAVGFALGALACGSESQIAPRTPVNAQTTEPVCVAAPAIEDGFPATFAKSQLDDPYRVERPRSIDLGAIGDAPLSQEQVPHHPAAWERPFPCHWTHTCRPVVVVMPGGGPVMVPVSGWAGQSDEREQ
jgi:hypothetical protein